MDATLVKDIGIKALLVGGAALVSFWIFNAVKLVFSARGINPLAENCNIFDTLIYARKLHPGQKNSLDALCKRYNVDNSSRDFHGALLFCHQYHRFA